MTRVLLVCLVAIIVFAMQGCSVGTVTSQQQQDKVNALKNYAKTHDDGTPPREERPR